MSPRLPRLGPKATRAATPCPPPRPARLECGASLRSPPGAPLRASWGHFGGMPDPLPLPCNPNAGAQPVPLTPTQTTLLLRRPPRQNPLCGPARPTSPLPWTASRVPVTQGSLQGRLPLFPLLPAPLARRPRGHSGRAGRTPLTWARRRELRASPVVKQSWLPWVGLL